jgi:hypothetical protein
MKKNIFTWDEINENNLTEDSGIYAWYYKIKLSTYDIDQVKTELSQFNDIKSKKEIINKFFNENIFDLYREEPYKVKLSGKLKPEYSGSVKHINVASDSLIERIVEKENILYNLQTEIEKLSVNFSSPLYIGMANNLSMRLNKHKNLIIRYRENPNIDKDTEDMPDESFAQRIIKKGYIINNLYVAINSMGENNEISGLLENIINRINFPILGRN